MSDTRKDYHKNKQINNREIISDTIVPSRNQYVQGSPKLSRYMPGLDGLRAFAVLAVIAYHLNLKWMPGGLLGVCLFFVLSGYLITDILTDQWRVSGHIDFKNFWLRRARRLLPALFVMLAVITIWTGILFPDKLITYWKDILAAVFYVSNWWLIFHHVSYFAKFGPPSALDHLWSLAVEEQFYMVWPVLLWLGLRFIHKRKHLVGLIITLALASAVEMAIIFQPGMDPSRVYYGTDTRAFALLIGAALAIVWPSRKLSCTLSYRRRFFLDMSGAAGLLIMLLMIFRTNEYETFLYHGGLLLFSLASAVVVAVLAHPCSRMGRLFGKQPLRWLGVRSYGIYLWHYPVIVLTSPIVNTGGIDVWLAIKQLAASILIAGLSWYFVEEPIRHGNWNKSHTLRNRFRKEQKSMPIKGKIALTGILLIFSLSCLMLSFRGIQALTAGKPNSLSQVTNSSKTVINQTGEQATSDLKTTPASTAVSKDKSQTSKLTASANSQTKASNNSNENLTAALNSRVGNDSKSSLSGKGITAIGDSIMVDASPELEKLLPGIVMDAKVGRQVYQAPDEINKLNAEGKLGNTVILELGTNGSFTQKQLTNLLDSLGKMHQIVLVNTRVPRPWQDVVNQTLSKVAASYPKAVVVNWYSASSNHNDYFGPDGVHLSQTGIQAYAALIVKAIYH